MYNFIKEKVISKFFKFLEKNQEYNFIFFNISCTFLYWSWQVLSDSLVGAPTNDNNRYLVVIFGLIAYALSYKNIIMTRTAGLSLQMFTIAHFGYTMNINNYHHVYVLGFVIIMVMQSLTFQHKKELIIFYAYSTILSISLVLLAKTNKDLLLYNSLCVVALGLFSALTRIKTNEQVLKQNENIAEMKIDFLNSKISRKLSNLGSSLTHEINTPLTTIYGYTDLIELQCKDNKIPDPKSIKKIQEQVAKIKEITNMLGLLSSDPKQAGNFPLTNMVDIKSDLAFYLESKLKASNIIIRTFSVSNFDYTVSKGKMFYLVSEIIKLFPENKKGNIVNLEIDFRTDKITFMCQKPYSLMVNDLKTMPAQIVADSCGFQIISVEDNFGVGIELSQINSDQIIKAS